MSLWKTCYNLINMSSKSKTFLYFAYGSNMLRERLTISNPSAVFKCVGKLEGYKLTFGDQSSWGGAAATISPQNNSYVRGIVWELDEADQENLDRQELNYKAIEVEVTNGANKTFLCRTYEMLVEDEGKPSPHYKDVILRGARQHSLPEEYIRFLESVEDNGFQGEVPLYNLVMEEVNKCLTLIS